ncbi:MAG: RNA polymerase sigma factor, partial [Flavobacteriaceae bacterium]
TEALRQDNKNVLQEVYTEYRQAFIRFGKTYNLNEDDILDIYQEAIIAMHQNFVIKKVMLNKGTTLKTYLFGIGKNLIRNQLKKNAAKVTDHIEAEVEDEAYEGNTLLKEKLTQGFGQLGESCREMIKLYYYRGLTPKEIASMTHYKDENTVKSLKSRCLKKLGQIVKTLR